MKECEEYEGTVVVVTIELNENFDCVEIECPICKGVGEVD